VREIPLGLVDIRLRGVRHGAEVAHHRGIANGIRYYGVAAVAPQSRVRGHEEAPRLRDENAFKEGRQVRIILLVSI